MRTRTIDGRRYAPVLVAAALLAALAVAAHAREHRHVEAIQAQGEIVEDLLLDVGIRIFDPGLPRDEEALDELEEKGVFTDVREAEARYLPVRLMDTLQTTGNWGAVRVVPAGTDAVDLTVTGTIVESNGRRLILAVRAADAAGGTWLEKTYRHRADPRAYRESKDGIVYMPFQSLYNEIANDLLAARDQRDAGELRELRAIAELAFAADLAPDAFAGYLDVDRRGRTVLARLPAADDPMVERVESIRERDYLFVDTLTEHYANFYAQMDESYRNWRQFSYEEEKARAKARRQARTRKVLGALAILGGVVAAAESGPEGGAIADVAVIGGSYVIRSGIAKGREAKMHKEALSELGESFDAAVEPMLVEVEGRTLRLTGSIEAQYAEWRRLLREIFHAETGLPLDPDSGAPITATPPAGSQES
jgi:hypothetical protein